MPLLELFLVHLGTTTIFVVVIVLQNLAGTLEKRSGVLIVLDGSFCLRVLLLTDLQRRRSRILNVFDVLAQGADVCCDLRKIGFEGIEAIPPEAVLEAMDLPGDWLRKMAETHLTEEERADCPEGWWKLLLFDDGDDFLTVGDDSTAVVFKQDSLSAVLRPTHKSSNFRVVWSAGPDCSTPEAQKALVPSS